MERLSSEEAMELLESQPVAHIGVVVNGRPYVTPMSFVVVDDRVLFRTMAGEKLEGIRSNPSVCIEAATYDEKSGDWASAIVRGVASEVVDDSLESEITSSLFLKYGEVLGSPLSHGAGMRPLQGLPHVIAVDIEEITGMSSGGGWSTRTRPGRL